MSESAEGRRTGRPSGASAKTLSDGALFAALQKYGHSPEEIAARQGCNRSWVYEAIKAYTKAQAAGPNLHVVNDDDAPQDDAAPLPPPRKIGAATLAKRVLDAEESILVRDLALQERMAWIKVVRTIHEYGEDGVELRYEQPGLFHGPDVLAQRCGCVASDLETLTRFGLLVATPDGIAMPFQFKLRPQEKGGRSRTRQAGAPDRAQPSILYPISGGRDDAPEAGNSTTKESRADGVSEDSPTDVSEDSRATTTTTKDNEIIDLGSGGSKPARDESSKSPGGESSKSPGGESSKTPEAESGKTPDPLATLTSDLAKVGRLARRPKDEDRGFVREWVAAGYAEDAMRAAIRDRAASKPASWQPASMSYYDGVVKERCGVRPPPAPAASNGHAEPAAPQSEFATYGKAMVIARIGGLGTCPSQESKSLRGIAWMDKLIAWDRAGRPDADKPPRFDDFRPGTGP